MLRLFSKILGLTALFAVLAVTASAQSTLELNLLGLAEGHVAHATVQRNVQQLLEKSVTGTGEAMVISFDLTEGEWIAGVDVPGYAVNGPWTVFGESGGTIDVHMTALDDGDDFSFTWNDDESYAGHATEFVPGDQPVIVVLNDSVPMPDDFAARPVVFRVWDCVGGQRRGLDPRRCIQAVAVPQGIALRDHKPLGRT